MKLSDYAEAYYESTSAASTVARQLAFAGIAVIWIFKSGDSTSSKLPGALLYPLGMFVFSLSCDLLHYVSKSIIWGYFHRKHEKMLEDLSEDPELSAPSWYNWIPLAFFWSKIGAVIISYLLLILFFIDLWYPT